MDKDDIIDFFEDHRGLVITVAILLVLFIICLGIRHHNLSKKAQNEPTDIADMVQVTEEQGQPQVVEKDTEKESFTSNVGLQDSDEEEETEEESTEVLKKPENSIVDIYCTVTGHTGVPSKNLDGSSCKGYLSQVSISDFDTYFGSELTDENLSSTSYILVGTEQIKDGDLQSTGWLRANLSNLDDNTVVYFTNLHVIGSLSDERVVLLCSYDWYSAYGLKDTLVVFEDISGTLSTSDYSDGDIISTVAWVKNIKSYVVNGQNIIHVEFATK